MKRIILLVVTFLPSVMFCTQAHGQSGVFPSGTEWEEIIVEPVDRIGSTIVWDTLASHIYKIDGDTIVGQKAYKKVECDGKPYGACIREAGGCVWMKADIFPEEFKLYDFNWNGTEKVTMQYLRWTDFYMTGVRLEDDVYYVDNEKHMVATDKGVEEQLRDVIYNLGRVDDMSRNSCLIGYLKPEMVLPWARHTKVFWLKKNGVIVYHDPGYDVAGITTQQTGQQQPASAAYDLLGRRVSHPTSSLSPLKEGIYIENGRKRVVSH